MDLASSMYTHNLLNLPGGFPPRASAHSRALPGTRAVAVRPGWAPAPWSVHTPVPSHHFVQAHLMDQLNRATVQRSLIIIRFPFSFQCPRHHLCSSKERAAVCGHLYGNDRRRNLRNASDEEGCVSASSGHFHPLL